MLTIKMMRYLSLLGFPFFQQKGKFAVAHHATEKVKIQRTLFPVQEPCASLSGAVTPGTPDFGVCP